LLTGLCILLPRERNLILLRQKRCCTSDILKWDPRTEIILCGGPIAFRIEVWQLQ
jgi:hypothetical protein